MESLVKHCEVWQTHVVLQINNLVLDLAQSA